MFIKDVIKKLNESVVRIGNVDYYPAFKVETELNNLSKRSVSWSIEDFENMAYVKKGQDWEQYYDKNMFQQALERMIDKHDASIGINWDVVEYYLEEMCYNRTSEGMRMDVYNKDK
jgi:hypothetical protein